MSVLLKSLTVGHLPTNCYIVACKHTLEASIIDPGIRVGEEGQIIEAIAASRLCIRHIVNTHGHPDHTSGNRAHKREYRCRYPDPSR
jgi:hydroxyacylglutathione hydrolase